MWRNMNNNVEQHIVYFVWNTDGLSCKTDTSMRNTDAELSYSSYLTLLDVL